MKLLQLQDIYDISQGTAFARLRNDAGEEIRVVQTRNLNDLGVSGKVDLVHLSQADKLRRLREGDVLINLKSFPVQGSVATKEDAGSIASSNIAILTAKPDAAETLDPIYLVGLLRSRFMDHALSSHMGGEGISSFSLRTLRTLPMPVPPKDAQLAFSKAFRALEQYVGLIKELVEAHTERLEVELGNYLGGSHDK